MGSIRKNPSGKVHQLVACARCLEDQWGLNPTQFMTPIVDRPGLMTVQVVMAGVFG